MKVTIKGFIHLYKSMYLGDLDEYQFHMHDMSDMGPEYVLIQPHEFEVEIPDDFDPRPGMIDGLRKQQQQTLADAQLKVTRIEERIQQLLCIEHKPEVEA